MARKVQEKAGICCTVSQILRGEASKRKAFSGCGHPEVTVDLSE